jgi:hypothetical protein
MSPEIEAVAFQIVDSAVKIHSALSPGLFKSSYSPCLPGDVDRFRFSARRRQHPRHSAETRAPEGMAKSNASGGNSCQTVSPRIQ